MFEGVNQIANTGNIESIVLKTAIESVLNDKADTAEDLFGSITNLKLGFGSMMSQLSTSQVTPDGKPKDLEATRYALGLLQLEKKLSNNKAMFQELLEGIEDTQKKLEFLMLNMKT